MQYISYPTEFYGGSFQVTPSGSFLPVLNSRESIDVVGSDQPERFLQHWMKKTSGQSPKSRCRWSHQLGNAHTVPPPPKFTTEQTCTIQQGIPNLCMSMFKFFKCHVDNMINISEAIQDRLASPHDYWYVVSMLLALLHKVQKHPGDRPSQHRWSKLRSTDWFVSPAEIRCAHPLKCLQAQFAQRCDCHAPGSWDHGFDTTIRNTWNMKPRWILFNIYHGKTIHGGQWTLCCMMLHLTET